MVGISTFGPVLIVVAAAASGEGSPKGDRPKKSADVVAVKLVRHSLADGLESYFVELKVAAGWHVYANAAGWETSRDRAKPPADATSVIEFRADGKRTSAQDIYYPKGVARKDGARGEYQAYEGTVSLTAWLFWDDTKDASVVSVRVRVVATDGMTRLAESIVTAETR